MPYKEIHDLIQIVKDLQAQITTERLNRYWPGFHVLPFALYDEKTIYLANHPAPPEDFQLIDGVHVGPGRREFVANTCIEFVGEQIGIWNVDYFQTLTQPETVYSKIIHEMFHAYEERNHFHLDYNEMMQIYYPFTKENITLLVQERRELLKAVFASDPLQRRQSISRFVAFREKRRDLLSHSLKYELGVETYEGMATYVEYQALRDRSDLPEEFLLVQFGKNMSEYPTDLEWFRFTCYTPGMYMSLLLDDVAPQWKEELIQSRKFLYDLFVETLSIDPVTVEMADTYYGQILADELESKRAEKVHEFHRTSGIPILFKGEMQITAFNPMQAIGYGDQILHSMFLGFQSGENKVFIKAPTLARHHAENMWMVVEAITFVPTQPVVAGGFVQIDGVGEIRGELGEENGITCIHISK